MARETLPRAIALTVPMRTVGTVLGAILFAKGISQIACLFLPLILGAILAISLVPVVRWLCRHGFRRSLAVSTLLMAFLAACVTVALLVLPRLYNELSLFVERLPELQKQALGLVPADSPFHKLAAHALGQATSLPAQLSTEKVLFAGSLALGGLTESLIVIVFTVYLVIDGPNLTEWVAAFFSLGTKAKLKQTFAEVSNVISAYVAGQFVTSALSFVYVLIVMHLLKVPSGLLLAVLAAVFDILPVLGFFLAVVPAMLFALRVSPATPLYVLLSYLFYHALENYLIAPAVYGNRMRLSSFVVLLSLFVAGLIGGVEGAIVVLPIVASYPIIERIWLKPVVSEETVEKHAEIEESA